MGSPYLSADESIILSAHDIVINTIPAEAILTSHRLMLVDRTHPRLLPQDIPFTAIETVTIGENSGDNPVLALSVVTPDETRQPLGVIFPQGTRTDRTTERDEWAVRIRELSLAAQQDEGVVPAELVPPWVPGSVPEENLVTGGEDVVPAGTRFAGPSISERRNRAAEKSTKRTLGILAAAVLIIAVIAVAILFAAPSIIFPPQQQVTPVPTPVTVVTTVAVTMPPATPATPAPTVRVTTVKPTAATPTVPEKGVWVRVKYDGSFSGAVGAPGRFSQVTGNGESFYQIPAKDELVSAAITKLDNSGNPLTVQFYNNGMLVRTATITKPGGTLELDVNLKVAITPVPS